MVGTVALASEAVYWLGVFATDRLGVASSIFPASARGLRAAEPADRGDRRRSHVALFLCGRRVAPQRRARGARPHPCAAGADPPALPLQQHEHDRRAHALRSRAGGGSHRGPRRPVPLQPARRAGPDQPAPRSSRSRASTSASSSSGSANASAFDGRSPTCRRGPSMPSLLLQPLLENAIGHGVEPLPRGRHGHGRRAARSSETVEIEVSNPRRRRAVAARSGNGIALDNIRQRLELAYPGPHRASKSTMAGIRYRVRLRFPLVLESEAAPAAPVTPVTRGPVRRTMPSLVMSQTDATRYARINACDHRRRRAAGAGAAAPSAARSYARSRSSARRPTGLEALEPLRRARSRRRPARHPHAGHGRDRGRAASGRARGAARGDLHDRLRRARARGLRNPGGRLPAEAGAPREARPGASARRRVSRCRSCSGSRSAAQLGRRRAQICARLGEHLRLIPVDDIYYFAADQKYVTVRHRGGTDLIDESLRALADEFAPDFVRVHRNSLVALRARAGRRARRRTASTWCGSRTATKRCR